MAGAKRRQEEERGVRLNPEIYIVEGADGFARVRRQHPLQKMPMHRSLPGSQAHVESSGKLMEQERPTGNRCEVTAGFGRQGKTGVF